jgi:hypothetical protein
MDCRDSFGIGTCFRPVQPSQVVHTKLSRRFLRLRKKILVMMCSRAILCIRGSTKEEGKLGRVARFFLVQYTKMGKIYQNGKNIPK